MRFFLHQREPSRKVDAAGRNQRMVGPQPHPGVADLTGKADALIDQEPTEAMPARFLFGSKVGLINALLARARADELALLDRVRRDGTDGDLATVIHTTWLWLSAEAHRPLLVLWAEAYTRSLIEPDGPWANFARQTVNDWLVVLASAQPARRRNSKPGAAERTLALSVLRGALLDLLATGDLQRTSAAVDQHLQHFSSVARS